MNKRASKVVLFTTIGLMIMLAIALGLNIKEDDGIEDISGDKEVLNNVNIIYQKKQGAYRTKEVKISKEEVKINEFAKALEISLPFNKHHKEQRDFYTDSYFRTKYNYEYENIIGFLNTERNYEDKNVVNLTFEIKEKNLETNKVSEYKIEIDEERTRAKYSAWNSVPLKYEDNLYALVIWEDENIQLEDKEVDPLTANREVSISIYKLDLENEKAELIDSKELKTEKEFIIVGYPLFVHNNKYYIAKDTIENITDQEFKKTRNFITYDVETKKFDTIDANQSIDINSSFYGEPSIEDDVANIATYLDNGKELELDILKLDLKTNKAIKDDELYTIKLPEKNYNYGVDNLRSIDNKLYIVLNGYEKPEFSEDREQQYKSYVYVIDEETKEILYKGLIKDNSNDFVNIDIVLDEEL